MKKYALYLFLICAAMMSVMNGMDDIDTEQPSTTNVGKEEDRPKFGMGSMTFEEKGKRDCLHEQFNLGWNKKREHVHKQFTKKGNVQETDDTYVQVKNMVLGDGQKLEDINTKNEINNKNSSDLYEHSHIVRDGGSMTLHTNVYNHPSADQTLPVRIVSGAIEAAGQQLVMSGSIGLAGVLFGGFAKEVLEHASPIMKVLGKKEATEIHGATLTNMYGGQKQKEDGRVVQVYGIFGECLKRLDYGSTEQLKQRLENSLFAKSAEFVTNATKFDATQHSNVLGHLHNIQYELESIDHLQQQMADEKQYAEQQKNGMQKKIDASLLRIERLFGKIARGEQIVTAPSAQLLAAYTAGIAAVGAYAVNAVLPFVVAVATAK